MKRTLIISAILAIIILSATTIFLLFQNQQLIGKLTNASQSPPATPAATSSVNEPVSASPSQNKSLNTKELQAVIKNSINSQNYDSLKEVLTENVSFALMSTECCGTISKQEAISQLDYINGGKPFDFNQQTQLVQDLKGNNAQLANSYIGLSQNGEHLAAFTIANGKINAIELSVSYKLYNQ